jgi:hypothetical protein
MLAASGGLEHVEIAIAIAGIERLHGCGNQKFAFSRLALAFAPCAMTYAFHMMKRVRHLIRQGGRLQIPLTVRQRCRRQHKKQNPDADSPVHSFAGTLRPCLLNPVLLMSCFVMFILLCIFI